MLLHQSVSVRIDRRRCTCLDIALARRAARSAEAGSGRLSKYREEMELHAIPAFVVRGSESREGTRNHIRLMQLQDRIDRQQNLVLVDSSIHQEFCIRFLHSL